MVKKLITLLLCAVMLLAFAACAPAADVSKDDTSKTADVSDDTVSEDGNPAFPFEERDYNQTINILCRANHTYGAQQFVPDDESSFGQISSAVEDRNNTIYEKYGITITVTESNDIHTDLKTSLETETYDYQLVAESVNNMLPYAPEKIFMPLNDKLALDAEWYDQNAISELAITDNIYFVAGDALIGDDEYCYCVLYNKDIYDEDTSCSGTYGDIYELVRNKEWTYDAMYTMAKAVTKPDEYGAYSNINCTYGLLSEGFASEMLVCGSGVKTATRSADGGFTITINSQKANAAFDKIFEIATDTSATILVDKVPESWNGIGNMFISGRGLFYTTHVSSISGIKSTDVEQKVNFGVLPIPAYESGQESYYSGINIYQTEVMAVPALKDAAQLEAAYVCLEALGYYSKYSVNPVSSAYYETTLKSQAMPTEDDEEMLDLVVTHRSYDLGMIFNWGNTLLGIWANIIRSGNNTFSSTFDSNKDAVEMDIQETLDAYKALVD